MSSEVRWWNEDRIRWYRDASLFSEFHEELNDIIESHIPIESSVLEVGCGLGYQGELLHEKGYDIISVDNDKEAIREAILRSKLNIFLVEDYRRLRGARDIVLSIFFGRITVDDNLDRLLDLAEDRLIYIQSCHQGQSDTLVKKHRSTIYTAEYLQSRGMDFSYETYEIPFPQPFKTKKDARDFILSFYPKEDFDKYMEFVVPTERQDFPYMLINNKKFALFDIKKGDSK